MGFMTGASMPPRSLLRSTLLALLAPRRLVPILLVATPMVMAQVRFSIDPLAGPLAILMCLVFFVLGPVSWRALVPDEEAHSRTFTAPYGRLIVYGVTGAGAVLMVGSLLPQALGMRGTLMTSDVSLLLSMALFWVGGYGLGHDISMEANLKQVRAQAELLAAEAERAQLLALRSHLDPHFLFNTLNAIAEWCRDDGAVAERATLQLSSMLRSIMEGTKVAAWPLQRELELIEMLLDLYRIRDPDRFEVECDVPESLPLVEIPPLLLLPMVENAIKHGPSAGHAGPVTVRMRVLPDHAVQFDVGNPGAFAGPRDGGQGLGLVTKRLEHAYGPRASFEIGARGNRTRARVRLPSGKPEVNT